MYSQNNEEEIIIKYFSNKFNGVFVDIGAFDPFTFSNTRKLYELGWSGHLVEPSKICFDALYSEYKNENNIKLYNFALGDHNGTIDFYETNGDAISTTSLRHIEKWKDYCPHFNKVSTKLVEINEFLNKIPQIDFINLDVESTNIELFNLMSDSILNRIKLICIEHDNYNEVMNDRLSKFGFTQLLYNGENIICGK